MLSKTPLTLLALGLTLTGFAQGAPAKAAEPKDEDAFSKATKDFESKQGMFTTWLKGEVLMFEIPKNMLSREYLVYGELKETPAGVYSGTDFANVVLRFEARGDKVLVRSVDHRVTSTGDADLAEIVRRSNIDPIIAALDVKATSPSGGLLVDVSRFFKNGFPELPLAQALGGAQLDGSRTFIEKVHTFPENINVEVLATASGGGGARSPFGGPPPRNTNSGLLHLSMVVLPEKPMMPRIKDSRVGFFDTSRQDFGLDPNGSKEFSYIDRYRLEKKDPNARVSEPVKPIVYYIPKEVPARWRKYVKQGVEDWQVAFEAAGFKNAILAKDPPNDPNWSPEDVRYSVIRWAPLAIENAMGPHVSDPRSGEILSAHVIMWHDVLKLGADWYFAQASANDPRAQKWPFPEELMGEILRFVVAHEVGHTLGLPHNGKSSGMIPCEKLRDPKWTRENGTCTSIMDYARFNYVAQPGDGAWLIPKVGAYDKFAIQWGYSPIAGTGNPWDERKVLDAWAARQVNEPMLRFYDNFNSSDPTALSEALGDDAVTASTYGVANLKRSMGYLLPGFVKLGEDYSELQRFHGALLQQFGMYISHVSTMVGGVVQTDFRGGRGGAVYTPVPAARQKAAVKWLVDTCITPQTFLVPASVMNKLGNASGSATLLGFQRRAYSGLLSDARLNRMFDNELMNGTNAYGVREMFADLRLATWARMQDSDLYSRNMQRTWVTTLIGKLGSASSEVRAYASSELEWTSPMLQRALGKTMDSLTRQHLSDLKMQVEMALKYPPAAGAAAAAPAFNPFGLDEETYTYGCGTTPARLPVGSN